MWYLSLYLKNVKIHFDIWYFDIPFGALLSAKYLNFGGENCEIKILSCSIQETYLLRKVKKQVLLFQSNWEPNLSDLMYYNGDVPLTVENVWYFWFPWVQSANMFFWEEKQNWSIAFCKSIAISISYIMTSQTGQQIITIHILPNTSRSKSNHIIKFG